MSKKPSKKAVRKLSATCSREVGKSENPRPKSAASRARSPRHTRHTMVSTDTSNRDVRLTGAPARTHAKGAEVGMYTGKNERFKIWRRKKFGGDFDPIAVAVDEAVSAYSRKNPEQDRAVWLSVANEIGVGAFRDKMRQMEAHLRDAALAGLAIYNKAAYFQGLLNRYTEHHTNNTKGASNE